MATSPRLAVARRLITGNQRRRDLILAFIVARLIEPAAKGGQRALLTHGAGPDAVLELRSGLSAPSLPQKMLHDLTAPSHQKDLGRSIQIFPKKYPLKRDESAQVRIYSPPLSL
jgi:hypothetical protein